MAVCRSPFISVDYVGGVPMRATLDEFA